MSARGCAWALALLGAACGGVSIAEDGGGGDGGSGDGTPTDAAAASGVALDILFVIDNSATMLEEQASLIAAFPTFIEGLRGGGELPSLHIGVVTSDMGIGAAYDGSVCSVEGQGGLLQNAPAGVTCNAPSDRFISDQPDPAQPGRRITNYDGGDLAATFGCIAGVGASGCGFERHLDAMRRALDPTVLENAGFVRDGAKLAIVIVADEDDCSASDVALYDRRQEARFGAFNSFRCTQWGVECGGLPVTNEPATYADCKASTTSSAMPHTRVFADAVRAMKPNPEDVLFAAIVGDPTPFQTGLDPTTGVFSLLASCTVASGTSFPGARFDSMRAEFGERGFRASICANDLTPAMQGVAAFIVANLR